MRPLAKGVVRSRVMWLNFILAIVSVLELSSAHFTLLWGPKITAAILLAGSIVNAALRFLTTSSLEEKGEA